MMPTNAAAQDARLVLGACRIVGCSDDVHVHVGVKEGVALLMLG